MLSNHFSLVTGAGGWPLAKQCRCPLEEPGWAKYGFVVFGRVFLGVHFYCKFREKSGPRPLYNYSVSLRAITSVDGMTADFYMFSNNQLKEISSRIINNVKGINRVLYDFTSKPPGTIEWE